MAVRPASTPASCCTCRTTRRGRGPRRPHPGAASIPWARAASADDATFKTRRELEAIYQEEQGLSPSDDVVAYCRIGERSSHTWFVLTHLLGFEKVRNYDGSWTEWGNSIRVPIVQGSERGSAPARSPHPRFPCRPSSPSWWTSSRRWVPAIGCSCCSSCSQELPELPDRYADATASMEQVPECQSPLFLAVEVEPAGDRRVHLFFWAPPEAPTTRGFASILRTGLDGEPAADILAVPDDFYVKLGLGQAVSPLRLARHPLARDARPHQAPGAGRGGLRGHTPDPARAPARAGGLEMSSEGTSPQLGNLKTV